MIGKAIIKQVRRVYDDFFKIDEFTVSYQKFDGTMSADTKRLVFERGDSVALLLLNVDTKSIVLVNQFKLPALIGRRRDSPSSTDGWITESIAGTMEANETPEATVIRETKEETGYQIRAPRYICKFFSSPGGTSERVFFYFAEVRNADKLSMGGGIDDEDIKVIHMPLEDLFEQLTKGMIEDPKLLIAANWLLGHMKAFEDRNRLINAYWSQKHPSTSVQAPNVSTGQPQSLNLSTVQYKIRGKDGLIVGYKTGSIERIKDVDIWVNSENTDMMMDRFLGKSISATIRFLGANKDEEDNVVEDTIEEALRSAVGRRTHVKIGTVLVTESGALLATHNVQKLFHVASVEGVGAGRGVKADRNKLEGCINKLFAKADQENHHFWKNLFRQKMKSILIPMIGSGDGGLPVEETVQTIIPPAIHYFELGDMQTLKAIYFLAFTARARDACHQLFEQYCSNGSLTR